MTFYRQWMKADLFLLDSLMIELQVLSQELAAKWKEVIPTVGVE